ncbi:hypothetical protein ACQUFY_22840 [Robbsia andropogonis]|uniref:hypothetical protein n=1 Tax=Robbsia andropogonis TaxID=28092 RepID=UPI003D236EAC
MDHDNAVHRPGGAGVAKVSTGKVAWMVVLAAGVAGYSGAALSASASSGSASSVARRDADSSAQMCARLSESAIPDGTVTSAKWVDAVNGKPSETLPAHCLVEGVLASRTGRPAPVTVNGAHRPARAGHGERRRFDQCAIRHSLPIAFAARMGGTLLLPGRRR